MNLYLLDAFADDFVFKPVSFFFAKRRALRKYEYFSNIPSLRLISSFSVSSLPARFHRVIPKFILHPLIRLELFIWERVNKEKLTTDYSFKTDDIVILFGYKLVATKLDFLIDENFVGKVIIHLSHYHVFDIPERYFKELNIELAFDVDITNHWYFKEKFSFFDKRVLEIPFQVSEKYINSTGERKKKVKNVAATGTYHKFKYDLLPFKVGNFSSLHPDRLLFSMAEVPENVAYHLHKFDSNSSGFVNFILKLSDFSQKTYFSLDLVELYSNCTYSFVGSEGTGVFGIGVIEAMACGSIPILSAQHKDTSPFDSSDVDVLWYETFDDLMILIESICGNHEPISQKNKEFAKGYSRSVLLKNLVDTLC